MPVDNPQRPGWQTEDLQDEWVDLDDDDDDDNAHRSHSHSDDDDIDNNLTSSISLTAPLTTYIRTNTFDSEDESDEDEQSAAVGTFLVHKNVVNAPLLPKTPGRMKKGVIKDIFSPLPLERMFEPPSPPQPGPSSRPEPPSLPPPAPESAKSDEIMETDIPNMVSFDGRKASIACQFTFTAPRTSGLLNPNSTSRNFPQAESTPIPPPVPNGAAPSEPPLRLFQFQYDTYTREHLSALVDSIAINTPSGSGGTTPSPDGLDHGLSKVSEVSGSDPSGFSRFRSAKRVKLSPSSDYDEGLKNTVISRPRIYGKDYVGASRSLMQQIKEARDFSTISTVASRHEDSPNTSPNQASSPSDAPADRRASLLSVPQFKGSSSTAGATRSGYTASRYRQQAANLMAQIKSDVKSAKRRFSSESETSSSRDDLGASQSVHSDKENRDSSLSRRSSRRIPSLTSTSTARTPRATSPRKLSRSLSTLENYEKDLSRNVLKLSLRDPIPPQPPLEVRVHTSSIPRQPMPMARRPSGAPPTHATGTIRSGTNEDLNRFVSSSTASGTTLTAGSAQSFVKHPGPPQIRTIAPSDVPALPERMGDMMFDKVMMKWVKNTARAVSGASDGMGEYLPSEEPSVDPFEDIESLRDDSRVQEDNDEEEDGPSIRGVSPHELSRVEERSESEDEEEMELTSFETDSHAPAVEIMTGIDSDAETTDSDSPNDNVDEMSIPEPAFDSEEEEEEEEEDAETEVEAQSYSPKLRTNAPPPPPPSFLGPQPGSTIAVTPLRTTPSAATPIRSALKNGSINGSAMRDQSGHKYRTPMRKLGHRRSVSFSDGKRDGPIRGLGRNTGGGSETPGEYSATGTGSFLPSARSKRIADIMQALEDSESDDENESPSKISSSGDRPEELQHMSNRRRNLGPNASVMTPSSSSRNNRIFSRSQTHRLSPDAETDFANATFLTECSFGVAHDRLVQVITDVEPFEPHWEGLTSIDLSAKGIESAARLKEFLPRLDSLNMNSNRLSWLSGIPGSVRTLSIASNCLTGVTSYHHLLNLESLDISRNDVESLRQLSCLRHLRELKADGNRISSVEGIELLDGLVKLSLRGNAIRSVNLGEYRWTRLEVLNLNENGLSTISGISSMRSLIVLTLDRNSLESFEVDAAVPKLRILRMSGNRLVKLNVGGMPNLRTLYVDNNSLISLVKIEKLTKLENLSLRNQSGRGVNLLTRDVRDVKRLYLTGNPLGNGFLGDACYNLVYVELAACRLTKLPDNFSSLIPNARVLNLNYNFLEDLRPLEGLSRLRKLTVIGSRLQGTSPMIRLLKGLPDLEMVDFRMNPCTLGWYMPLLVKTAPGALQPSEEGAGRREAGWQELDAKFRHDLPTDVYIGRMSYRGRAMQLCPKLRIMDGVEVSTKEKVKATALVSLKLKAEKSGRKCKG